MKDEYANEQYVKEKNAIARNEEKIKIATSLLDVLDIETIAMKTGLSVIEVEELKT